MADDVTVDLGSWNDLVKDLHQLPARIQREVRAPMRAEAQKIVSRAASLAPRQTGNLASHTSIRVRITQRLWRVVITWTEPYSGVQEWATTYTRKGKNGPQTVHMTKGTPPRFANRAATEIRPQLAKELLTAVGKAMVATGYWKWKS